MHFDVEKIRRDFPILRQKINSRPLVYFDNAASTQKPQVMIDELVHVYSTYYSNIHRGVHTLSQRATAAYDETRSFIASLYKCKEEEVIFTKNDTESLNLIAYTLGMEVLEPGTNIVLTEAEHHSNVVPWQLLQDIKRKVSKSNNVFEVRFTTFDQDGFIDLEDLKAKIDRNTRILSFVWGSNTFGTINNAEKIIKTAKSINPDIRIIVDAAQFVPHSLFNFKKLGADFVTFSAHKMCGPTGVGVLIGRKDLLEIMPPFLGGGDMIREVQKERSTFADLPNKFEAGTPNIADVIAFKKSLEYLDNIGFDKIYSYEQELAQYLLDQLNTLEFAEIYGPKSLSLSTNQTLSHKNTETKSGKVALVLFNLKGVHAHDVGTILDEEGVAVRTGQHCTQLIMRELKIPSSVRASLYIYNTREEIDVMIKGLKRAYEMFG